MESNFSYLDLVYMVEFNESRNQWIASTRVKDVLREGYGKTPVAALTVLFDFLTREGLRSVGLI